MELSVILFQFCISERASMLLAKFTLLILGVTSIAGMVLNGTNTVTASETEKCACNHDIQQLYARVKALENSDPMERSAADFLTNIDMRAVSPDEIGFTVALDNSVDDLPAGSHVLFDRIYYNAGSGYDSSTGVFICPRAGMYIFAIFIHATSGTASATLKINGVDSVDEVSEPAQIGQDSTGGNVLVRHLMRGDRVWVQIFGDSHQDLYHGYTTFSGALLHGT